MKNAALYIITGEETLLVNEAVASVEATAHAAGFTDKHRFDQDNSETWERFIHVMHARSLFAEKSFLVCRFSNQKISVAAQTALQEFATKLPTDKILMVVLGKLTPAQQNAAWLQALKKAGNFMQIWPVTIKQFPQWLKQRLHKAGFQVDPTALELICDHTEGNLLAAAQCVEKCQLLYAAPGKLDAEQLLQCLVPSARYTVFDLVNALALRDLAKMNMILDTLREEGCEPAIVLWAIARECRRVGQAQLIPLLNEVDQTVKGIKQESPWRALQRACFAISGRTLL